MIAFIKGVVEEVTENTVVLDCGGVGYELFVTQGVFKTVSRVGEEVKLNTYLQVREDGVSLFGFADREELELFKLLITVSGIGPKGAVSILSFLGAESLRFAILSDDVKTISKAPGIGQKTAGKVILELRDKMDLREAIEYSFAKDDVAAGLKAGEPAGQASDARNEAVMALSALGFSQTEALKAVKKVEILPGMESDEIIKQALKYI